MASPGRSVGKRLGGPGFEVVEGALAAVQRHRMLRGGETVVVAVSGGADSMCLLDVLARVTAKLDLRLVVAHVDHGLSDESQKVAARVASVAAADGYEVHVARAPSDLAGPNLQARARAFRYSFLDVVADREGAAAIATGHTLDDRVETVVARLIHGAGSDGLAGMPVVEGRRIRPLAGVRRAATRAYCVERKLWYFDDPANEDLRFERVAVRTKVIAAVVDHWGEGAVRAMAASADRLREDAGALAAISDRLYDALARTTGAEVRFARDLFDEAPRAVRRRLLQRAVGRVRDRSGGIDAALDALDSGSVAAGARFAVAAGAEIAVEADAIVVRPASGSSG